MDAKRLAEILDAVRRQIDLRPVKDDKGEVTKTFCNIGIDRIMGLYGVARMTNRLNLQPLMANDMVDCMEHSPTRFKKVDGEMAARQALEGVLVIAGQKMDGHGHVAAVYPAPVEHSGSWGKGVPLLNNIGKKNEVMRASMCFKTEPAYYSTKVA